MSAIYADYRNPLAHAWAVSTKEVGKHPNKRVVMDGSAKVLGVVKQALTEGAVAALEVPTGRAPSWLTPVVVRNAAGGFDLYPHSLYWGTRRMVERLTRDRARMQQAIALFATITTALPQNAEQRVRAGLLLRLAAISAHRGAPAATPGASTTLLQLIQSASAPFLEPPTVEAHSSEGRLHETAVFPGLARI